jgi:hypothetical protein
MFNVFTRLGDGEFIFVASRDQLGQAMQLVQELNAGWPHEYVVRDAESNNIEPSEYPAIHPNRVGHDPSPSIFQ